MLSNSYYLETCAIFVGLPPSEILQDCPTASIEAIHHGSVIHKQGQHLGEVFCVLEGQVKLARLSLNGAEFTTGFLTVGELFGASLDDQPLFKTPETATAKGTGKLLRVRVAEFRKLLLNHPDLGLRVVELLDRRRQQMERRLECFAFKRTETRLVETLHELSRGFEMRCVHGFG